MTDNQVAANPFGMMINPEAIIDAMHRSDRLDRLNRRVYRPLDKPMIPKVGSAQSVQMADAEIDDEPEALIEEIIADDLSDVIAPSDRVLAY